MPSSTVSVGFKPGDFFYNTSDTNKNTNLLATFPFGQTPESKQKLIDWANDKTNTDPPITSISDIFDPKISKIILNPDYDFTGTFLPGNMTFNDNFNALAIEFSQAAQDALTVMEKSSIITGNILLIPNSGAPLTLAINSSSNGSINWKQDETNSWKKNFQVSTGKLSDQIPFTDSDGVVSNIIMTTDNPRCKYRENCTLKHWHYNTCTSKINTKTVNGKTVTTCNCSCSGGPVYNDTPHSHCDNYTINSDGTATTAVGTTDSPAGVDLLSIISSIKLDLSANFPGAPFNVGPGGNVELPYKDEADLKKGDENIRKLVFDYYFYVDQNRELQQTVQKTGVKDSTMKQAIIDATVEYKNEYLNVFNIVAGIFGVVGYIYLMTRNKKTVDKMKPI
jgi:hypothetical protein